MQLSISSRCCLVSVFCSLVLLFVPGHSYSDEQRQQNHQKPLIYDIGSTSDWVPFGYTGDKERPGILVELIKLIMEDAKISIKSTSLPPKRAVMHLEEGGLDFDIVSPNWFKDGAIGYNFVQSKPLLTVIEYFITLPENKDKYQSLNQVYGKVIGTVAGYAYFDDDQFIRSNFPSESAVVLGLKKGRFEVAIMERLAALHWSKVYNIPISFPLEHTTGDMVIRLRAEYQSLLPRINKAIKSLQENGKIDAVLAKYQPK